MISKINEEIEVISEKIKNNDLAINKLFELLDDINKQRDEVNRSIESLQLENQASNNEIKRLEIVKGYLEEVKKGEE